MNRGSHLSGGPFHCCGCGDGGADGGTGGTFVPADLPGLVLDLNPAIGVTVDGADEVQTWADQGTGGNDVVKDTTTSAGAAFVLTPAAIGGLPGLVSDPTTGSSLVSAAAAPVFAAGTARTVFVVARVLQADNGCIFVSFQPSGGLSTTFSLGLWNFGNIGTIYPYTDGITVSQATPQGPGYFENETMVFAYRFDGAGDVEFSVNGSEFAALAGDDFASETGSNGFHIGRFIGTSFQGAFKGTMGRILGYNTALSDEDALRVITFLLEGYGVAGAIVAADISDSSAAGRSILTADTAAAQAALLGSAIPVQGTALTDADQTLTVAGGNLYTQATALTANRVKTLGTGGTPIMGEVITIIRLDTAAFTLTVKDDAATTLVVLPASTKCIVSARWNGTHFADPSVQRVV